MELVETIQNLNVTETTMEEKRIFRSENLADYTYDGIMEKYDSYCFTEFIPLIKEKGFVIFRIIFVYEDKEEDF